MCTEAELGAEAVKHVFLKQESASLEIKHKTADRVIEEWIICGK